MKRLFPLLFACLPLMATAQDEKDDNTDPRYLTGAVTYSTDGKVEFTHEIKAPSLPKDQLFTLLKDWAEKRFQPNGKTVSKVVYANAAEGDIAVAAEEYIVFNSSALSLDRTRIYYQLLLHADNGTCRLTMTRIRYWYDENRDGGQRYTAEEWIGDDMALNKKKTKLAPICGKFRKGTVNLKDNLFQSAATALGQQLLSQQNTPQATAPAAVSTPAAAAPATVVTPATTTVPALPLQQVTPLNASTELQEVSLAQLPASLGETAANGRMTLTADNGEEIDLKADNWGGFGQLFNKNVAYLLLAQSRIAANALLAQSDTYKISFYTAGHTQPSVVVECKKAMSQKMTADDLKSLNVQTDSTQTYTMYMGEVSRTLMR